jgi:hypothetical protein
MEDTPEAVWHQGAARKTAADGHTTNASATVTSATGRFSAADVDHTIGGTGITAGSFIKSVTNATTVVLNQAATATGTTVVLTIDNSTGRDATATTTAASNVVNSTTANFVAGDVSHTITATSIPRGATITQFVTASQVKISANATAAATNKKITIGDTPGLTTARVIRDGHTTSASTTLTSASAKFGPTDVGLAVTGTGIPANDYIKTFTNATTVVLNAAATATSTTATLNIGAGNSSAPTNGEMVGQLETETALNPGFVDGYPPCSANVVTGTTIDGVWENVGSFNSTALGAASSTLIKGTIIAQILVPTSLVSIAAYVSQVAASTAGETQTAAHYDVTYPQLLTGTAVCPAPSTVGSESIFRFIPVTPSQGTTGRGTVRTLNAFAAATTTKTTAAYVHVQNGATVLFSGTTNCTETYPGAADLGCGNG